MSKRPVPATYRISQYFDGQFSTKYSGGTAHGAIDFATPVGTPVIAPDDGVIEHADWVWNLPGLPGQWTWRWYQLKPAVGVTNVGGGIMTVLRNDLGSVWIFAHLSDNNMVRKGQRVRAGDVIGLTGNTGSSTGPHLHVALLPPNPDYSNGTYGTIDPLRALDEPYAPNTQVSWAASKTSGKGSSAGKHVATKPKAGQGTKKYTMVSKPTGFQVARSFYGYPAKPAGITLHHWGDDGQKHDNVDAFLTDVMSPARKANPTSAHEVISDGRVTVLAKPEVATYHSGSTKGNGSTIGLEIRPEMSPGDLDTLVQRIYDIEVKYGSMPIYLHKHWFATACPGRYEKQLKHVTSRVNAMHKNGGQDPDIKTGTTLVTSTSSTKDWFDMATAKDLENAIERVLAKKRPRQGGVKGTSSILDEVTWNNKNFAALTALVRGVPASTLKAKVKRPDGTTVDLATALAYERENWNTDRTLDNETNKRIDALEAKLDAVLAAVSK